MPKGYIVLNIDIHDPEEFQAYRSRSMPYAASRGGRYIVATNEFEEHESPFNLKRLVILEFPSLEAAKATYEDPYYQKEILPYRVRAATSQVAIVEGRD